jgi:hypothetical protein
MIGGAATVTSASFTTVVSFRVFRKSEADLAMEVSCACVLVKAQRTERNKIREHLRSDIII